MKLLLHRLYIVWEFHAPSYGRPGFKGCEIEGGMREACEGCLSCFVDGVRSMRDKKAANSPTLVSSYYAKAG